MRDFIDFRFGNIYTKDLHLLCVSSGDRYEKNLLPDFKDYTKEITGGNGQYYFGSTDSTREFTFNVAFDSVDEVTWRRISQLFSTDKMQDLVFDELPYKTYKAKLKSRPTFNVVCFTDRQTKERVYKGEGTLNFICYSPYAYGFNKYVVRAADNYFKEQPKLPDYDSKYHSPYEPYKQKIYNKHTREFYNVAKNMDTPWKGGYPTFEQVRAGELYFNNPDGKKEIIDVRRYFHNLPEWAATSKLLVSPTLDYEMELIFMPQYSKYENINMDIGINGKNGLIGSRFLVYNPGDLPVEFNLDLNRIENYLDNPRAGRFQIRRYNVQRLSIPQAVDWTGLKTLEEKDNVDYKYGHKYFKCLETDNPIVDITINGEKKKQLNFIELKDQHPEHAYIAEPIPQEHLGDYIRLFYWQSSGDFSYGQKPLKFEDGERIADRYEELRSLCIDDDERNELYWKTLKEAILDKYLTNVDVRRMMVNNYKTKIINRYRDELFEYYKNIVENQYDQGIGQTTILPGYANTKYKVTFGDNNKIKSKQISSNQKRATTILYKDEKTGTYYDLYSSDNTTEKDSKNQPLFLTKREIAPPEIFISFDKVFAYDEESGKKIVFYIDPNAVLNSVLTSIKCMAISLDKNSFEHDEFFKTQKILEHFLFENEGERVDNFILELITEKDSKGNFTREAEKFKKLREVLKGLREQYKEEILSGNTRHLYKSYENMIINIGKKEFHNSDSNTFETVGDGYLVIRALTLNDGGNREWYYPINPDDIKIKESSGEPYVNNIAWHKEGSDDKNFYEFLNKKDTPFLKIINYDQCVFSTDDSKYKELFIAEKKIGEKTVKGLKERELFTEEDFFNDSFFKKYNITSYITDFLLDYYKITQLAYNYIHMPPEFLQRDKDLDYGEDVFSIFHMPQWYTKDYLEIRAEDLKIRNVKLDTDKRMLYNIYKEDYSGFKYLKDKRYYHYEDKKNILNDYIEEGHWFKIPPGWSLIDILPVCDADEWGGKRWLDARPFKWGYDDSDPQQKYTRLLFNEVFETAWDFFGKKSFRSDDVFEYLRENDTFLYEHQKFIDSHYEYEFLKLIHTIWKTEKREGTVEVYDQKAGLQEIKVNIKGTIEEWWWYACNYMWENFPPLYWGYADLLNDATIDYTPLFY